MKICLKILKNYKYVKSFIKSLIQFYKAFTTITKMVRTSMEEILTKILTPKRIINLI